MPADPRLSELLSRWKEHRSKGTSAEELCADCPELLDELKKNIHSLELRPIFDTTDDEAEKSAIQTLDLDTVQRTLIAASRTSPAPTIPGYEILGELGRGGMGIVYKARQVGLKRVVALKMIRAGAHINAEQEARFRREAEAVASLQHPNIVQIYEIGEHEGTPFFSLEYVEGGTLRQKTAGNPQPPREAATLVEKLARALQYAHERGIVHRDLKPANILLAGAPTREPGDRSTLRIKDIRAAEASAHVEVVPKISDFGLAKQIDDDAGLTQSGDVVGTPCYMAPEQAWGQVKDLGPAVDIYALGATLFELLTGRPPFKGKSVIDTLDQVRKQDPAAPSDLEPTVPRDLETICLKCLAKDPRGRYPSALALADDLRRFLEGRPIAARPISRRERVWRWCRRNPFPTALIGSCVLGTLVAIALTIWALDERDRADAKAHEANVNAGRANDFAKKEADQRSRAEKELARALLAQVRESSVTASPGWTWKALDDIAKAQKLQACEVDPVELRGLMADSLGRPDLRLAAVLAEGFEPGAVGFSKDGKRLAVGEKRNGFECSVRIFDVATRQPASTLIFSSIGASLDKVLAFKPGSHEGINSLAFSPDGKWLVAGTRHGKLVRWDTTAAHPKSEIFQAKGGKGIGSCLAFSPDGAVLVAGAREHAVRWDVRDRWVQSASFPHGCVGVAFTPDGNTLALAAKGTVRFFDGTDLQPRASAPDELEGGALAISPHGRMLALQSGTAIHLIDVHTGRACAILRISESGADHGVRHNGIQFSGDGSLLVAASTDNRVRVWDVGSGKRITELFVPDRDDPLPAFSPDGRYLAIGADRRTLLYELRSTDVQATLAHHNHSVQAIEFANDGAELVASAERVLGDHAVDHETTCWDAASGKLRRLTRLMSLQGDRIGFAANRGAVAVHNGQIATVSSLLGAQVLPSQKHNPGRLVLDIPGFESAIEVPRSDLKFTGAGVEVRDDSRAQSGQAIRIPGNAPEAGIRFRVPASCRKAKVHGWSLVVALRVERTGRPGPAFEFSLLAPAGRRAVAKAESIGIPDDNYHLWLCDIHEVKALAQHDWIDATITLPDKSAAAAAWIDRAYLVPFKRQSGNMTLRQEHLTFAPDGSRLWGVVDSDHVVSWNLPGLRVASHWHDFINASLLGYARIDSLAVGRKWVLAGNERGETILISAATGEKEKGWLGTDGGVRAVALHPSETIAAVGTQKGNLRLIRIPSGEVIATLPRHEQSVESICFSRDGQLLVTGSLDQTVRLMRRSGNGYELLVALKQPTGRIASVRLSADNAKLAVLSEPERAVRLWRLDRLRHHLAAAGMDW